SILDGDYVIGVWASASRQQIRTLNSNGTETYSGTWIQVSRIGMPLTNEAVIPIGDKDRWNSLTPYSEDPAMEAYFCNPELALYMDASQFGNAVPAFAALRVQRNSLQTYDFGNTQDGLWPIRATNGGAGTALDTNLFGNYLLRQGQPRSVDLLPIFYTGVPNLAPYHLATGKNGNPLANGKPFINNFLPTFGDMLRLNMAVPVTPRNHPLFSSLGLVQAAVLGLTDPAYSASATLQNIPNMDGFPNGRRLEDDVTRIELQAVSGVVLAAIGLWYDDYTTGNPVTTDLVDVLTYTTGIEANDTTFKSVFPYVQGPWSGFGRCGGPAPVVTGFHGFGMSVGAPGAVMAQNYPNPVVDVTTFKYNLSSASRIRLEIFDISGQKIATLINNEMRQPGTYELQWNVEGLAAGVYVAALTSDGNLVQSMKVNVAK
ncbi:MAG: DUF4331 family protein, partial [Bacteroidota bacterium]|nr:DUF4331 family protein [Bacteroidota bacterium]